MADVVHTLATAIMANQRVPDMGAARRKQADADRRMVMFRARRKAEREAAARRPKGG